VKVTGLTLGYLSNKKSERKGSEREASSCTVEGHMIKKVYENYSGEEIKTLCAILRGRDCLI